ncbi:MAG TPA: carbonic anhydrase, partial [Cytophagales bacterium]|nr:carbonic anhydrase [Cytophagales bacterium]
MSEWELYESLLEQNKEWVAKKNEEDPDFFSRLSGIQRPKFLWIRCSFNRVAAH